MYDVIYKINTVPYTGWFRVRQGSGANRQDVDNLWHNRVHGAWGGHQQSSRYSSGPVGTRHPRVWDAYWRVSVRLMIIAIQFALHFIHSSNKSTLCNARLCFHHRPTNKTRICTGVISIIPIFLRHNNLCRNIMYLTYISPYYIISTEYIFSDHHFIPVINWKLTVWSWRVLITGNSRPNSSGTIGI